MKLLTNIMPMFNLKTKKANLTPNILLTNFCNQKCPYCFAKKNMSSNRKREMSVEDFLFLTKLYQKNGIREMRLLGGEPTLHSHFLDILDISSQNFKKTWIFTNLCISEKVEDYFLQKSSNSFNFVVNIDTIAFNKSATLRQQIIGRIANFSKASNVYLAFTISDINRDYVSMYDHLPTSLIHNLHSTFGIEKPILGEKPFFDPNSPKEKVLVGQKIIQTVKKLIEKNVKDITIDCGLTPDMFSVEDIIFLKKNVWIKGWGCQGFWGSFDIDTDLTINACFPYSQHWKRQHITNYKNLQEICQSVSCKKMCFQKTYELLTKNE